MIHRKYSDNFFGNQYRIGFVMCRRLKMVFASLCIVIGVVPTQLSSQPFANGKSKWLGNVYGNNTPQANWDSYWNQVTPENAGKWLYVEGNRNEETWGGVDAIYNFAKSRNIPFRWHTLVWGQQYPSWIDALPDSQKALEVEEWIRHVGERYPKTDYVDVVNEPLTGHAPATYRNALGGNGSTGWDWVIWVFQKARKYMPMAKLFINDYNILNNDGSTNTFKSLIDTLKARNLIDGIGIQCHRFEIESAPVTQIKNNLDKLGSTGLPIHITEFDLGNINNSGTPNDSVQLLLYKQRFPLLWEHPAVKGITIWGYVQGYVWQTTSYLCLFNGTERPAIQWLRKYVVAPPRPTLISPAPSATGIPRNAKLFWRAAESATLYGIQIANDSMFKSIVLDISGTDTVLKTFPLEANKKFFWRVNAANARDTSEYSAAASFTTGDQISSITASMKIPATYMLSQNYPNPFNPTTTIKFAISQQSNTSIKIYNTLGELVATLFDHMIAAGEYSVEWNAINIPSGMYFYTIHSEHISQTKKLLLIK